MQQRAVVAVYARISQDRDGEGLGVRRQVADCRAEADRLGWTVAEEYVDDDVSAYSGKARPAYERMLEDLRTGRRDAVIVWHMDRLHRRPVELEQFADTCQRAGVNDVRTLHGSIDLASGDGLLMARLLAAVAANESHSKQRRGQRKMAELADAGRPHGGGTRPFGFEADKVTHRPDEADVIRVLTARALAGESLTSLARWLDEQDVRTVMGKPWRTPTLRQLLLGPRIYGMRAHDGTAHAPGAWEPIITPADGERLRVLLSDPTRRTNRTARRYLLSGLCRCSRCGTTMLSVPRYETRRYLCRSGTDFGGCGRMAITAAPLEAWVVEAVLYRLDSPAMAQALTGGTDAPDGEAARLAEALRVDRDRLDELAAMYADGEIDRAGHRKARDRIEARAAQTQQALNRLTRRRALDGLVGNGEDLRRRWESLNLTRQAAIVKAVLEHLVISPATVPGRKGLDPSRVRPVWRA